MPPRGRSCPEPAIATAPGTESARSRPRGRDRVPDPADPPASRPARPPGPAAAPPLASRRATPVRARGHPVVAALLVVKVRGRSLVVLLDRTVAEQPAQRAVEHGGAQPGAGVLLRLDQPRLASLGHRASLTDIAITTL